MSHVRWLALSLLLISMCFRPASAQARALLVFGNGGRMFPLANLSANGDDLGAGKSYGGGIGLQLGPATALRASITVSKSKLRGPTLELADSAFTRAYYGADLMIGVPSSSGLAPYLFFGGGRITLDPAEADAETVRKLAGRMGTGVNIVPDNSFFVVFAEASGWIYHFDMLGFDRIQLDVAAMAGLAFAVPF